jgi:hypothetical protein
MTDIDFDARYTVDGWRGIAFYLTGYVQEPDEDTWWSGVTNEDRSRVVAVMVGDDREHIVDVDDLTKLEDGAWCVECGQVGCGWHTTGEAA